MFFIRQGPTSAKGITHGGFESFWGPQPLGGLESFGGFGGFWYRFW